VGRVAAIGSVVVNGVRFSTSGASITVDDSAGRPESELKVGMIARVRGTINSDNLTGSATSVEIDNEIKGPLDAAPTITATGGSFSVFGITILVDNLTVFDNVAGLSGIAAGAFVEVDGLRNAAGNLVASRVELKTQAVSAGELTGSIGNVTTTTFQLGATTFNYASAILSNVPASGLSNGMLVEVKFNTPAQAGVVTATRVEVITGGVGADNGARVEVEGYIANLSGSNFNVAGQPVTVTSSTVYEGGTQASLANDLKVEVEGTIASGVLTATKVQFKAANNVRAAGQIRAINASDSSVTLFGSPGVVVRLSATTLLRDQSDARVLNFNLGNAFTVLQVGDRIEVEGGKGGSNVLLAAKLERTRPDTEVELRGPVDSAATPNLVILGVTGQTSGSTQFQDVNDTFITPAAFFALATTGRDVKVKGTFNGTLIVVEEAEIEN
jgi:hypothetical protein